MRSLGTTLSFAIVTCAFLSTASARAQDTWFVDDDGTAGNGCTSWADACPDLQTALGLADDGDQIWVAAGTYRPSDCDGGACQPEHRSATFQLISGVEIYGGFDGTEDTLEERAGLFDDTILTGDLSGDDMPVACTQNAPDCDSFGRLCVDNFCIISDNNAENSYHVTTGSGTDATAILDGFTISAGHADGESPDDILGAGMFNNTGSPTVANCTFTGSMAARGGGVENQNSSSPIMTDCTFSGNWASSLGGGMQNREGSHPTMTDCTFSGNVAGSGGGMHNFRSSPTLTDCTFDGNTATDDGGGICSRTGSNPMVTNCTFSENSADDGGGMHIALNSNPTLSGCTFSGNSARFGGGGINLLTGSSTTITDCTFSGNAAVFGNGGGIDICDSNPTISHCTFSGNTARDNGGGMRNWSGSSPTVTHCTFSGNSADRGGGIANNVGSPTVTHCTFSGNSADIKGGGMYNANSSNATVDNSILWGDSSPNGPEIYIINNSDPAIVSVAYSDIQGGEAGVVVEPGGTLDWGDGNIDSDPLFVDPDGDDDEVGTVDDDLRLSPGSPCIDAAKNELVPADTFDCDDDGNTDEPIPCDLDGNPRFVDDPNTDDCQQAPGTCGAPPVVDMGAFEFQGGCAEDADCDDNNSCTTDECVEGECQNLPVDCSEFDDQCNTASCDPVGDDGNCDILTPVPDGTECDDGDACTENDICTVPDSCSMSPCIVCEGTPIDPAVDCNDNNNCTIDICESPTGCVNTPDPGASCGEGPTDCSAQDTCDESGVCQPSDLEPGTPCPVDGNECTDDVCDGEGVCMHPVNTDPCDDGLFCNGADICEDGACNVHEGDPCTGGEECNQACNEGEGHCFDSAGAACGDPSDSECDNSDTCDGGGTCLPNHEPLGTGCTDDANDCTDDVCDGEGACTHANNTDPCDDGLFCNGADTCSGGACDGHAGDPCDGGAECNTNCNEDDNNCLDPEVCPLSSCVGASCTLTQNLDLVTDGGNQVACSQNNGTLVNAWARCFDLAAEGVTGDLTINSVTFGIQEATVDGLIVRVNLYLDSNGCPPDAPFTDAVILDTVSTTVGPADEGSMITLNFPSGPVAPLGSHLVVEIASGSDCVFGPLAPCKFRAMANCGGQCGPSFWRAECTVNRWNDLAFGSIPFGHLLHLIEVIEGTQNCGSEDCDDGNPCTIDECIDAECQNTPVDCSKFDDQCNVWVCNPDIGECEADPLPPGTSCDDEIFCNGADTCSGGACDIHEGDPCSGTECNTCQEDSNSCFDPADTACGDPNDDQCTNPDTCDGSGSCQPNHEVLSTPCEDGSFCTSLTGEPGTPDHCDGDGSCVGVPVDCDNETFCDGVESCNEDKDSCDSSGDPCPGTECNTCQEDTDSCFDLAGTACGDPNDDQCDNPDTCNGKGSCLPNDEPPGTACGDPTDDECTDPDTCDGSGSCLENHELPSTECRADAGECDVPEFCDGAGNCPADGFEPDGAACGDKTDDDCTDPDTCDDSGNCRDNHAPPDTPCMDDANECTDDACSGTGACTHPNNTDPCDDGDACTEEDTCSKGECGGTAVDCSSADDECNDASCDPEGPDGNCDVITPLPDGTPCGEHAVCEEGTCAEVLHLDVMPRACPNGVRRGTDAAVWMALLGTDYFDITQVRKSTIELRRADGVGAALAPKNLRFMDESAPFEGELCDCHVAGRDGITDLRMKFKTAAMVEAFELDEAPSGVEILLRLTGALNDGTPFVGSDCILILR